jgi:isochorismate hydrolase
MNLPRIIAGNKPNQEGARPPQKIIKYWRNKLKKTPEDRKTYCVCRLGDLILLKWQY